MQIEEIEILLERIQNFGFAYTMQRFYSVYRGRVDRNDDEEKRGRVQVTVEFLGSQATSIPIWIDGLFPCAGPQRGWFHPPEVGDVVWVVFLEGDTSQPLLYYGSWFAENEVPSEMAYTAEGDTAFPEVRGFVSRLGHMLLFKDKAGSEELVISWHKPAATDPALNDRSQTADRSRGKTASIVFDKDGSITITDSEGQQVLMDAVSQKLVLKDANNNSYTMSSTGISLETGGTFHVKSNRAIIDAPSIQLGGVSTYSFVKGETLIAYLAGHFHTVPIGGVPIPTTPPVTPPIANALLFFKVRAG